MTEVHLDWSSNGTPAAVGDPKPCRHCSYPALLREPGTGRPCHKVCAERELAERVEANAGRAA